MQLRATPTALQAGIGMTSSATAAAFVGRGPGAGGPQARRRVGRRDPLREAGACRTGQGLRTLAAGVGPAGPTKVVIAIPVGQRPARAKGRAQRRGAGSQEMGV